MIFVLPQPALASTVPVLDLGLFQKSRSTGSPTFQATAALGRQSRSHQVSGRGLLETGIFLKMAGDFRRFGLPKSRNGSLETGSELQNPAVCGPFLRTSGYRKEWRTAWLGREGSNLRMAESKSAALPLGYAPTGRKGASAPSDCPPVYRVSWAFSTALTTKLPAMKPPRSRGPDFP